MDGSDVDKTDIKGVFELAMQLYNSGEIDKARDICRRITEIQINFDNVDELYYKGMSHIYSMWETAKAIRCFKKILEIGTTNVNIIFDIGIYLCNNGYQSKAIDCFNKVLNLTEDIIKLHGMAFKLEKISKKNIASEYYNKILDLQDNNVEDKYCKGNAAYCLFIDSLAIKYFKEIVETDKNIQRLYNAANKLSILHDYEATYKCLSQILKFNPTDIVILCGITKLFYILRKPNETVECIEKILKLQTNDLINLYDLADFLDCNKILYSTKLYQKIVSIQKPKYSPQELYIKATCSMILGKPKDGMDNFNKAIKENIKDINNIFSLNIIACRLLSLNKHDFAICCFQKIINLSDTSNGKNENSYYKSICIKSFRKKERRN
ncbi:MULTISPECIES: tetratricopeptide repeat protein [unclassified Sedimentibacter]|uniref:tetratricopeptide repeat protein n=1 Tax=unclassified Sedimentibacter TaxID=2649220 RepID=UPI0027E1621F|nr:tetratricopeptide repeat protein [Sedimentibacter sp. MB35-C1]WMJ78863.1 tetratricopeptide repeat protein [Sedimentibacter sp. MB35-C1]